MPAGYCWSSLPSAARSGGDSGALSDDGSRWPATTSPELASGGPAVASGGRPHGRRLPFARSISTMATSTPAIASAVRIVIPPPAASTQPPSRDQRSARAASIAAAANRCVCFFQQEQRSPSPGCRRRHADQRAATTELAAIGCSQAARCAAGAPSKPTASPRRDAVRHRRTSSRSSSAESDDVEADIVASVALGVVTTAAANPVAISIASGEPAAAATSFVTVSRRHETRTTRRGSGRVPLTASAATQVQGHSTSLKSPDDGTPSVAARACYGTCCAAHCCCRRQSRCRRRPADKEHTRCSAATSSSSSLVQLAPVHDRTKGNGGRSEGSYVQAGNDQAGLTRERFGVEARDSGGWRPASSSRYDDDSTCSPPLAPRERDACYLPTASPCDGGGGGDAASSPVATVAEAPITADDVQTIAAGESGDSGAGDSLFNDDGDLTTTTTTAASPSAVAASSNASASVDASAAGAAATARGGSTHAVAWKTRYCCFGCSVKEATLIIAIVFIVIRVMHLVCACLAYVQLPSVEIDPSLRVTWLPTILVVSIVDCVFEIASCILLLKASKDDNRYLLIPWLVYNSICILYNLIGAIHFLMVSLFVGLAGLVGGILVVFLSIRIYFFLIVAVYYKLLLEGIVYVLAYPPTSLATSIGDIELNANSVTVNVSLPLRGSGLDDPCTSSSGGRNSGSRSSGASSNSSHAASARNAADREARFPVVVTI